MALLSHPDSHRPRSASHPGRPAARSETRPLRSPGVHSGGPDRAANSRSQGDSHPAGIGGHRRSGERQGSGRGLAAGPPRSDESGDGQTGVGDRIDPDRPDPAPPDGCQAVDESGGPVDLGGHFGGISVQPGSHAGRGDR